MSRKTIFEKNIAILDEKYPELAEKTKNSKERGNYKLIRPANGYPNVLIKRESEQVFLYDPHDPVQYAQKYIDGLKIKFAPFIVFMGFGLGYHFDYYMKQLGKNRETKEIIIYEKDVELFRLALSVIDFGDILKHPNIHFFVGEDPEESFAKLRTDIFFKDVYALRSIKILPLPASIVSDHPYYLRAVEVIKKAACQIMRMLGNDSFDSMVGMEHMFLNLKHIFSNPGINDLYGKFNGKPGVLVASGPSLGKNMHLLKGLRDNALIVSCDTALIPMKRKGIHPHLVTSLERTPEVMIHYHGLDDFEDIYFITLPILTPETVESFKGKKFIAYRNYRYFNWLEADKGSLVVGHSVANLAFKILAELGCNPIILIGQDLAYAEDGDTHDKRILMNNRDKDILDSPVIELEGNDGKPVKSILFWEMCKLKYEEDIVSYTGTCINATEGGAKIRGAQIMTFRDAIERYCKESYNPQSILDEVYNKFSGSHNLKEEMERVIFKTYDTRKIVEKGIGDFEDALNEAKVAEKEIIQSFREDEACTDVDMGRLLSVERKWLEMSKFLMGNKNLCDITLQILNPYDVWLASELSFLKDIYTDPKILSMARVEKMKDWFAVVGSFLIFIRNVLKNAGGTIEGEIRGLEGEGSEGEKD